MVAKKKWSMPAIVGTGDAWEPLEATFACDRCGDLACTLTLLPPFARDPQAPLPHTPGWLPGQDALFSDSIRLSIDGPAKVTHTLLPEMAINVPAIEAAMKARDPIALYTIDREYAPFWCRPCAKSYCRDCWAVWVDFDEGFYDCTRGRCPQNHVRIIDD